MDHRDIRVMPILPGRPQRIPCKEDPRAEAFLVMIEGRTFPGIGQKATVDGREILKWTLAQHIFTDSVDGRQESTETEFGAVGIETGPVDVGGMPAAEERPVQDVPEGQAFVQEMGIPVLGQE